MRRQGPARLPERWGRAGGRWDRVRGQIRSLADRPGDLEHR
jgi:hypothetical protein